MGLEGCFPLMMFSEYPVSRLQSVTNNPLSWDLGGLLKPVNDSIRRERLIVAGPINVR